MPNHIVAGRVTTRPPQGCVFEDRAAAIIGEAPKTLRLRRTARDPAERRRGPSFLVVDGWRVCYRLVDLEAYLKAKAEKAEAVAAELRRRAAATADSGAAS